jgi:DNA-binding LacI/PurR family transcriptional regulator
MSVRLRDIADQLGISVSTVSLALRAAPQIAEETRIRVRDAAAQLGYVHRPRLSVRTELAQVAFITQTAPDNVFYAAVLSGAERECRHHKIALHYTRLDDSPESAQYGQSDGLLVVGSIGEQIIRRLARIGHRRIAFLSGVLTYPSFNERRQGYYAAVSDLGIEPIEILWPSLDPRDISKLLGQQLHELGHPNFTALITCNDLAAITALHTLQEFGVHIPNQVSVVGFDDIDIAAMVRPALTTNHVDRELLGKLAVRRLIERANDIDSPAMALAIETLFVERSSTKPLGTAM